MKKAMQMLTILHNHIEFLKNSRTVAADYKLEL